MGGSGKLGMGSGKGRYKEGRWWEEEVGKGENSRSGEWKGGIEGGGSGKRNGGVVESGSIKGK